MVLDVKEKKIARTSDGIYSREQSSERCEGKSPLNPSHFTEFMNGRCHMCQCVNTHQIEGESEV